MVETPDSASPTSQHNVCVDFLNTCRVRQGYVGSAACEYSFLREDLARAFSTSITQSYHCIYCHLILLSFDPMTCVTFETCTKLVLNDLGFLIFRQIKVHASQDMLQELLLDINH